MKKPSSARRSLLGALAALALVPLVACGGEDSPSRSSASAVASSPHAGATGPAANASTKPFSRQQFTRQFKELERKYDARLGVYAIDTGTGREVTHNDGERFAHASTFKALAAGAVLRKYSLGGMGEVIRYSKDDLVSDSPVSEKHVATGMSLSALCDAAVRFSDNTAANLLLDRLGGPRGWTPYSRGSVTTSPGWNTANRNSTAGPRVPRPTRVRRGHSPRTCARSSSETFSVRANARS